MQSLQLTTEQLHTLASKDMEAIMSQIVLPNKAAIKAIAEEVNLGKDGEALDLAKFFADSQGVEGFVHARVTLENDAAFSEALFAKIVDALNAPEAEVAVECPVCEQSAELVSTDCATTSTEEVVA